VGSRARARERERERERERAYKNVGYRSRRDGPRIVNLRCYMMVIRVTPSFSLSLSLCLSLVLSQGASSFFLRRSLRKFACCWEKGKTDSGRGCYRAALALKSISGMRRVRLTRLAAACCFEFSQPNSHETLDESSSPAILNSFHRCTNGEERQAGGAQRGS